MIDKSINISVSQAPRCQLGLCLLHDDHRRSISKENTLSSWDEASVEASDALCAYDVTGLFQVCISDSFGLCLSQVLKDFKWPDQEEASTR